MVIILVFIIISIIAVSSSSSSSSLHWNVEINIMPISYITLILNYVSRKATKIHVTTHKCWLFRIKCDVTALFYFVTCLMICAINTGWLRWFVFAWKSQTPLSKQIITTTAVFIVKANNRQNDHYRRRHHHHHNHHHNHHHIITITATISADWRCYTSVLMMIIFQTLTRSHVSDGLKVWLLDSLYGA